MIIARQSFNVEIYRGDNIYEEFTVVDDDDVAVDITGCSAQSEIKRHVDGDALLTLVAEVTDPANGLITVRTANASDTENLDFIANTPGVWDVQITTDDATPQVYTTHRGDVTYVKDVTD